MLMGRPDHDTDVDDDDQDVGGDGVGDDDDDDDDDEWPDVEGFRAPTLWGDLGDFGLCCGNTHHSDHDELDCDGDSKR